MVKRRFKFSIKSLLLLTTIVAFSCFSLLQLTYVPQWEPVGRELNSANARFRLRNSRFGILWIKTNNMASMSQFYYRRDEPTGIVSGSFSYSSDDWHLLYPGNSIETLVPIFETTQRVKVGVTVSNWIGRTKVVWSEYMPLVATNDVINGGLRVGSDSGFGIERD